jgi:DNA polymerase-3 subunit delta'
MFFKEIPGKEEEKKLLMKQAQSGRIPHAQLFLGREGSGALALALAYASYVVCTQRQESDSCGMCAACIKSHKLVHPDIHFAFPVVKSDSKKREDTTSADFLDIWRETLFKNPYLGITQWLTAMKAEKSQPNINVKECNEIIHKLNLMPYESEYKVMILWLPEYLGKEGNRLLKLIEEPPDNTVIILAAQQQDMILSTIISRCQLLKVKSFEDDEVKTFLQDHLHITGPKADQIANLAEGNLNLAISLSNNDEADFSAMLFSWFRLCYAPDPIKLQDWLNGFGSMTKDDQKSFLEYGIHFLRCFILMQSTDGYKPALTAQEIEVAQKMHTVIDIHKAEKITYLLNDAVRALSGNANAKILMTADSLTIGDIMKGKENVTLREVYG